MAFAKDFEELQKTNDNYNGTAFPDILNGGGEDSIKDKIQKTQRLNHLNNLK